MSINFETPPGWQANPVTAEVIAGGDPPGRSSLRQVSVRPRIAALYDERFCRMWEFCEAGFRLPDLVAFKIQISRRLDAVPITRDYIATHEQGAQP